MRGSATAVWLIVGYWAPVLVWSALIIHLSSIPSLETGMPGIWDLVARKIGHVAEYAVLALLLGRALRAHGVRRIVVILSSATLTLLFAVSDELHQTYVPGREGSPRDIAIDGLGIALWMALAQLGQRIQARFDRLLGE